jgi:hypothetical protein
MPEWMKLKKAEGVVRQALAVKAMKIICSGKWKATL